MNHGNVNCESHIWHFWGDRYVTIVIDEIFRDKQLLFRATEREKLGKKDHLFRIRAVKTFDLPRAKSRVRPSFLFRFRSSDRYLISVWACLIGWGNLLLWTWQQIFGHIRLLTEISFGHYLHFCKISPTLNSPDFHGSLWRLWNIFENGRSTKTKGNCRLW